MNEGLAILIMDISAYSICLPAAIGLIRLRNLTWEQQIVLRLVGISIFFEFAALYIGAALDLKNLPLLHIFTVLQFYLLALIYRRNLPPVIPTRIINWLIIVFVVIAILSAIFLEGLLRFNTYPRALESIMLIFFSLTFFYKTLKELKIKKLEREPVFWINSGVLIYFSGSLLIFIVSNYFFTSDDILFVAWGIHAILNIVNNLLYGIALWVRPPH